MSSSSSGLLVAMELTPIYIRGKRRKAHDEAKFKHYTRYLHPSGTKTKRPISGVGPKLQRHISRRPRHLAKIELLPSEMLQSIFSHCHTIDLALSSHYLAKQLSHPHIYLATTTKILYEIVNKDALDSGHVQCSELSRLLRRRWMTYDVFSKALAQLQNIDLTSLDLRHARLPPTLLKGPWTMKKAEFLHVLCLRGACLDWDTSTDSEIAAQGLADAITERAGLAVALLVCPQIAVIPTLGHLHLAVLDNFDLDNFDRTIVFHLFHALIRYSKGTDADAEAARVFLDPGLWKWAAAQKGRDISGRGHGEWLERALRSANTISSTRSRYRETHYTQFMEACGKVEDGVEQLDVPR